MADRNAGTFRIVRKRMSCFFATLEILMLGAADLNGLFGFARGMKVAETIFLYGIAHSFPAAAAEPASDETPPGVTIVKARLRKDFLISPAESARMSGP